MGRIIRWIFTLAVVTGVLFGAFVAAELYRRAAPTEVVTVPFQFTRQVIRLSVGVNGGGPYNLFLDTGTDPSVLDLTVAESIAAFEIPLGGLGVGAGGNPVDVALIPPFRVDIPGLRPRRLLALAVDLSGASERMGVPVHGILGHNFLRRYKLEIDYPARELRFLPLTRPWSAHGPGPTFESAFENLAGENFPLLPEILVNGSALRATLDTGSNVGVTLYRPGIELLGLQAAADEAAEGTSVVYGGVAPVRRGVVDSVRLGPLTVDSVTAAFVLEGDRGETPLSERGANLGNGVLMHFVVGLDYPNGSVAMWQPWTFGPSASPSP